MGSHPEYLKIDAAEDLEWLMHNIPEDLPITYPGAFLGYAVEVTGRYLTARGFNYGPFAVPTNRITVSVIDVDMGEVPLDLYEDPIYGPSIVLKVRARGSARYLTLYVSDSLDIIVRRHYGWDYEFGEISYGSPEELFRELEWNIEWLYRRPLAHDSAGDSAELVYSVAAMQWVADLWYHWHERGGKGRAPFCPEFGQDEDGVYVTGDGHAFWENGYWTNFTITGLVENATFEYGSF